MLKKNVSVILSIILVLNVYGANIDKNNTVTDNQKYAVNSFFEELEERLGGLESENAEVSTEATEEMTQASEDSETPTKVAEEVTQAFKEDSEAPTKAVEEVTQASKEDSEAPTKVVEEVTQVSTKVTEETTKEEKTTKGVTEASTRSEEVPTQTTTVTEEIKTEVTTEVTKTPVVDVTEEVTTQKTTTEAVENVERVNYYKMLAKQEAEWLWEQQLSNGAFAFYNEKSGSVYINPYFSEIVAIALINYDDSSEAGARIRKYFDWHFAHINTAESDYNGLAGTIYDYDVVIADGIVVSEASRGVYDSTDSYSALYIKALADYAKVYGDEAYLLEHSEEIMSITNVMFATMSGGYTYAKPDYAIRYLMDNAEVYAGLVAAEYIYSNVIEDDEMLEQVSEAVKFYKENFNKDWWKGDHYATVLNPDNSEYTGYVFSWEMFYPCATAQMFPVLYGIIDADSSYAKVVYDGLCTAWNWQDMDYISKGESVFCWGNFAYLGALMEDEVRLSAYMNKYGEIVDGGRLYPLYSAESAMVLMGCLEYIR